MPIGIQSKNVEISIDLNRDFISCAGIRAHELCNLKTRDQTRKQNYVLKKVGHPQTILHSFSSFCNSIEQKISIQRDSNSDQQSRRQGRTLTTIPSPRPLQN